MTENFSDFLLNFISRDNLSGGSGSQRPHHLPHDSLKSIQEAVADIPPEHIRSLHLSPPGCNTGAVFLRHGVVTVVVVMV